jgi:thiol-disulfide isomerase/thioredoxin
MSIAAYHFWSPTCGPCKVIKPAIDDLKDEFPRVDWTTVNTHDDPDNLARKFSVTVVPTIVVITYGQTGNILLTEKQTGTNMASYYRIIRNAQRAITP